MSGYLRLETLTSPELVKDDPTRMSTVAELPSPLPEPVELANRLTHGLGLALAMVGTGVLINEMARYGDALQVIGVSIYGATLISVYAASTLSHTFAQPRCGICFARSTRCASFC